MESLRIMDSPGSCDSVISTNSGYVSAAVDLLASVPLTLLLICSLYNATCRHTLQICYFAQAFLNKQKFWQCCVVGNKRSEICASCCSNVCMHIYSQKEVQMRLRGGLNLFEVKCTQRESFFLKGFIERVFFKDDQTSEDLKLFTGACTKFF